MPQTTPPGLDIVGSWKAVAQAGQSWSDAVLGAYTDAARSVLKAVSVPAAPRSGCCEIPSPCWMPVPLGELRSVACAGATASVQLRVTNGQPVARQIEVLFAPTAAQVDVAPPTLQLGPMERGRVTATVTVPTSADKGWSLELLLWVRGCRSHFLRWTVEACDGAACGCHEIDVLDAIDPRHHWYDHFYCARPCPNPPARQLPVPPAPQGAAA